MIMPEMHGEPAILKLQCGVRRRVSDVENILIGINKTTYHTSKAPNVRLRSPRSTNDDFGRSILSSLDIFSEVVTDPTSVTQISNLDINKVRSIWYFSGSDGKKYQQTMSLLNIKPNN
jgi:hypothetical protein